MDVELSQVTPLSFTVVPLAKRLDFHLGNVLVRPSLRTVSGPKGSTKGEPRVIQVLVALAEAQGSVLTREDLLRLCWEGRIVGDDAINRAVAEVRRIAATVGAEFAVETVPRIGFRVAGVNWKAQSEQVVAQTGPILGRRNLILGGLSAAAILAGGGAAIVYRQRDNEVDALIERGRVLQSSGGPENQQRAEAIYRLALGRNPGRADAWGRLASVLDDQAAAREAAMRSLSIDPREPNARAVLAFQQRDLDAWTQWEDTLLGVLSDDPNNSLSLSHLTFFYQGMGRCRDSWISNERAIQLEPFNSTHQHRRAIKHWIFGRVGEADKVADQALHLWPRNPTVWNARMLIYAFTGRAAAALALLDDLAARPVNLTSPSILSWRAAISAIATRAPADIVHAVEVCTDTARLAPGLAANAIMAFSYLGELDAAYRIAGGLLEGRGTAVQEVRGGSINDLYAASSWGRTQFLFIPATAAFRADSRFMELCDRMGHVAYWRKRGVWPDPFVLGALDPAQPT